MAKLGRPPIAALQRKSKQITVRLSSSEFTTLEKTAQIMGKPMASLVRAMIANLHPRELPYGDESD